MGVVGIWASQRGLGHMCIMYDGVGESALMQVRERKISIPWVCVFICRTRGSSGSITLSDLSVCVTSTVALVTQTMLPLVL